MPSIFVVIPCFHSDEYLAACLASLAEQEGISSQVLIVDNSASDETRLLVKAAALSMPSLSLSYIADARNLGYATAVNMGLRNLGDEAFFLVINPDLRLLAPATLLTCVQAIEAAPDLGIVSPGYVDAAGDRVSFFTDLPTPLRYWRWVRPPQKHLVRSLSEHRVEVEWMPGAFLMLRAEVARRAGGMDERIFLYAEDADWCHRVRMTGRRNYLLGDLTVFHAWGHAADGNGRRRVVQTHLGRLHFAKVHASRIGYALVLASMLCESVLKMSGEIVQSRRNWRRAGGYWDLVRLLPTAARWGPTYAQNEYWPHLSNSMNPAPTRSPESS